MPQDPKMQVQRIPEEFVAQIRAGQIDRLDVFLKEGYTVKSVGKKNITLSPPDAGADVVIKSATAKQLEDAKGLLKTRQ